MGVVGGGGDGLYICVNCHLLQPGLKDLLKVDIAHLYHAPLVVLVPAKSLWTVHHLYQMMHLRELLRVIHLPTDGQKGDAENYVSQDVSCSAVFGD